MERQNSKHELTISDNSPKRTRKEVEGSGIGVSKEPCKFIAEALSNFLVLQNIFGYLDGEDLESCNEVNRCWNFVIGQIYTRHFDVILKTPGKNNSKTEVTIQNHATIRERPWSSKPTKEENYSFSDALKFILEKSSQAKIAIDLDIRIPNWYEDGTVTDFLPKVGVFVHTFSPYNYVELWDPVSARSDILERYFPNLHHLDLSPTHCTLLKFVSDLKEIPQERVLKSLKKITFRYTCNVKVTESVIKMAPNLEEIHEFPLIQLDALVSTGKSHLVKSISYRVGYEKSEEGVIEYGASLETALKTFALLEPKLTSFSFSVYNYGWPADFLYRETLEPSVRNIFRSSQHSLETLEILPSKNFDFQDVPPMTSLKNIGFRHGGKFPYGKFFSADVDLQRIFPNVTAVEVFDWDHVVIGHYLKPVVLFPWGSQIKDLRIKYYDIITPDEIQVLGQCFPSIKNLGLEFRVEIAQNYLKSILKVIANSWPQMESIKIKLGSTPKSKQCSFDSVITGISDEILSKLKDPMGREKFTEAQIEDLKKNSTIRKLSKLKRLKLDYTALQLPEKFIDKLSTITSLSKEFGFDFLPSNFKIIVRGYIASHICQDLRTAFSGVVPLDLQVL